MTYKATTHSTHSSSSRSSIGTGNNSCSKTGTYYPALTNIPCTVGQLRHIHSQRSCTHSTHSSGGAQWHTVVVVVVVTYKATTHSTHSSSSGTGNSSSSRRAQARTTPHPKTLHTHTLTHSHTHTHTLVAQTTAEVTKAPHQKKQIPKIS